MGLLNNDILQSGGWTHYAGASPAASGVSSFANNFLQAYMGMQEREAAKQQAELERRYKEAQIKKMEEPSADTSKLKEYFYAVKNEGFKGSFVDWAKLTSSNNTDWENREQIKLKRAQDMAIQDLKVKYTYSGFPEETYMKDGVPVPKEQFVAEYNELVDKHMGRKKSENQQPKQASTPYKTAEDVKKAFNNKTITKDKALEILRRDFGFK